jgi:RimK family alpha-L-glutamate ligase
VSAQRLRVAVLGSTGGWHARRIERALTARGHECAFAPVTRMVGRIDGRLSVSGQEVALQRCDVVLVRGIPRGSLEQVVFRVDALHALAAAGVRAVNGAHAIERTVDKFLASALLAGAGLPTPRTIACERPADALEAFGDLGGDVIVKPLFGSMGLGMVRVDDRDVAQRVFRALEVERAVYYLQETLPHAGHDVRALVVGDRVVAAIERVGEGWRTNLARGADARPVGLDPERERLCVRAAAALGADYAGVDLLRVTGGRDYVIEVNGIPGWQGVEYATGVDVAAALTEHLEAVAG